MESNPPALPLPDPRPSPQRFTKDGVLKGRWEVASSVACGLATMLGRTTGLGRVMASAPLCRTCGHGLGPGEQGSAQSCFVNPNVRGR
jgi:hypothetical protein